jgi:hypothetical protein
MVDTAFEAQRDSPMSEEGVVTLFLAGALFAAEVWLLFFRPDICGSAAFQSADLPRLAYYSKCPGYRSPRLMRI